MAYLNWKRVPQEGSCGCKSSVTVAAECSWHHASRTLVYCGQTVGWIKMKLGLQVGIDPGHIVLDGDPALAPQKGHSPQFSAHICCGQTAGWIKTTLGTEVSLGPGHIVLDGDPAPPTAKKGTAPQFSAHICCGQTAGWIKMPLGVNVGLVPGHIVLDGDPAPPPEEKGDTALNFRPMSVVVKRLDGSGCHLVPRHASAQVTLCYMETQLLSRPKKRHSPQFSADVYSSQTVAHFSYCCALVFVGFFCFNCLSMCLFGY